MSESHPSMPAGEPGATIVPVGVSPGDLSTPQGADPPVGEPTAGGGEAVVAPAWAPGDLGEEVRFFRERNWRELSALDGMLMTHMPEQSSRSLLVTSCSPGDGKTVTAVSMACSLARSNRVILVDANLRSGRLHTLFHLDAEPGLVDLVMHKAPLREVIRPTAMSNLMVIPRGSFLENTASCFLHERFRRLVQGLSQSFAYVLFDAPFYLGPSDASLIAPQCSGTVVVISAEKTRWEVVNMVKSRVEGARGRVVGVVMNQRRYYIPQWAYRFL